MDIFTEVSLILVLVMLVSIAMRLLRQPLIVGYILAGILAGPHVFNIVQSQESLDFLARLGITVLLFIVGLQLSPKVVKEIGGTSVITGVGQVLFTALVGLAVILLLGVPLVPALYLAVALTFSSTIIILKLLGDYGGINKLHGKLSIGFLLVQDLIASAILILVGTLAATAGQDAAAVWLPLLGKAMVIGGVLYGVTKLLIPRLSRFFAASQELLFLFSLTWGLGLAALFHASGFSVEIGALLAGVTLSVTPFAQEMGARLKPLRDFFIVLFFILLGSRIVLGEIGPLIAPAAVLSLFILIGNPLIVFGLMRSRGYHPKTALLSGFTVAQISEFSLILVALGVSVGQVPESILSLATLVGLITIAGSTYFIIHGNRIYGFLAAVLARVPGKSIRAEEDMPGGAESNVIIFGYDHIGERLVGALQQLGARPLVVDYNPDAIDRLADKGIHFLYGDADDPGLIDDINFENVIMVISTIPETETNINIVRRVRRHNPETLVMAVGRTRSDAELLYEEGATYVIMPDYLGAHYAAEVVVRHGFDRGAFREEREKHLKTLGRAM